MRAIKRWLNHHSSEHKIQPRRDEVLAALQKHFSMPALSLKLAGKRGHDNNYIVSNDTQKIGVLRLVNPYKNRKNPASNMPFTLPEPTSRLERERTVYEQSAPNGLTPKPLWHTYDALLCGYIPYTSLMDALEKAPDKAWNILTRATKRLHELHCAGMTHMDASLSNILTDESLNHLILIDFEYGPAPHISPAAQRLYDHLRLVESTWKFIPEDCHANSDEWFEAFAACLDDDMRRIDLKTLEPALGRIFAAPEFMPRLEKALAL